MEMVGKFQSRSLCLAIPGMTSGVAGGYGVKGVVLEQDREEDPGLRFRDSCHYGVSGIYSPAAICLVPREPHHIPSVLLNRPWPKLKTDASPHLDS